MELVLVREKDRHTCGGEIIELPEVTYVPLFIHGGYGEATRVRAAICLSCWTVNELSRETVNPRVL